MKPSKDLDTNQASEDELMRQLGFRYEPSDGGYYIHEFVKNQENPSSLNSVLVPEVAKQIHSIIRTEKLKLLAEVRERVVGEDETTAISGLDRPYILRDIFRDEFRANQRIELAKLEAEL